MKNVVYRDKIDTKLPLVADYCGAMINVSIKDINFEKKITNFYAPVFGEVEYRLAAPIIDYQNEFKDSVPTGVEQITFSCNCILNYAYSELEGKKTANMIGPITFGEIAYQLLNQTLVYLNIEKI